MHTPWVSFDGKNCGGCKHLNDRGYCEFTACIIPCTVRATIPEIKPRTNADRIRSMTDEEIEAWYWWMHKEMMYYTDSHAFVHDWLKQEVEE